MSSDFQNRLRKNLEQPPGPEHPAPDLLNAYTEHALTAAEERQVTEHLSRCAECREVLYLASAAAEEPEQPVLLPEPPRRRRWIQWAAPAAAVLAIASAIFFAQFQPSLVPKRAQEIAQARKEALQLPAAKTKEPSVASEPRIASEPSTRSDNGQQHARSSKPDNNLPSQSFDKDLGGNQPAAPSSANSVVAEEESRQEAKRSSERALEKQTDRLAAAAPSAAPPPVYSPRQDASPAQSADAAVAQRELTESSAKTAKLDATRSRTAANFGYSSGTMVAKKAELSSAWQVTPDGGLVHVLLGATYPVLADSGTHFLTVTTLGKDVWAGGKNLALYHSPNNGTTWERQTLRIRIAADIVHIAFDNTQEGILETNLGTRFATHDGGKTWTALENPPATKP